MWFNGSTNPSQTMHGNMSGARAIFVTSDGNLYLNFRDSSLTIRRIDRWTLATNTTATVLIVPASCYGVFIDISKTLYCSMAWVHKVEKKWLDDNATTLTTVAGTGFNGSGSYQLYEPHGIFVDTNFDLYVTDSKNNRIQLFRSGQSNGTTVAGSGSSSPTFTLDYPTAIVLDANKYLFIADSGTLRIIGSDQNGFRCLVGCSPLASSGYNRFDYPWYFSFDNYGNIFFVDPDNHHVQKLLFSTNSCGKQKINSGKVSFCEYLKNE